MKPGHPIQAAESPDRARPIRPLLYVAGIVAAIAGALVVRALVAER
jgi:hypothetical protein